AIRIGGGRLFGTQIGLDDNTRRRAAEARSVPSILIPSRTIRREDAVLAWRWPVRQVRAGGRCAARSPPAPARSTSPRGRGPRRRTPRGQPLRPAGWRGACSPPPARTARVVPWHGALPGTAQFEERKPSTL